MNSTLRPLRLSSRDLAALQHADLIVVPDRAQAVRDGDHRPGGAQDAQRLLDLLLRLRVERRGGLVEHHDGRLLHEAARDRQPLLLAATEFQPALTDDRVLAAGRQKS